MRPGSPYQDPRWEDYLLRKQTAYSLKMKRIGPYAVVAAQKYVSQVRAMRRVLRAGGIPSLSNYRPLRRSYPKGFLHHRLDQRLVQAIVRGETSRAIARRSFFGGLGRY